MSSGKGNITGVNVKNFIYRIGYLIYIPVGGASDSITGSSVLSNPADAQIVSCLGLCGRDICPKSFN